MNRLALIIVMGFAFLAVGCTSVQGNFTVISNKDIDLTKKFEKTNEPVETDSAFHIISWIPVGPYSDGLYKVALDKAHSEYGIDYIGDARVTLTTWYIPLIYGKSELKIVGDGYKQKK